MLPLTSHLSLLTSHLSPLTSHLLIGIVPDKLPTQTNYEIGWAHNYSLPREISLAADGTLIQKPYSGLTDMRTAATAAKTLNSATTESLAPVSGRQIELLGDFNITTGTCGFRFLKSGSNCASLTYDADRKTLTLNLTALKRQSNDNGSYNGIYTATLPEPLTRLHVFLDASIADIFVNDRWAFSVRLFPTDANATEAEVFATSALTATVQAWMLDANRQESDGISQVFNSIPANSTQLTDLLGRRVQQPHKGSLYILNGRKYVAH